MAEADKLKNDVGATVFTIGVGDNVNEQELIGIANEPTELFYHHVDDYEALEEIQQVIAALLCNPPEPETTSTSTVTLPPGKILVHRYSKRVV